MKKKSSEAEKKQKTRYQINIKLDREKDKDIIETVKAVKNKQGFIKKLIREK